MWEKTLVLVVHTTDVFDNENKLPKKGGSDNVFQTANVGVTSL